MPLYKPELFQGSLEKENYFEGWYFKNVSAGLDSVLSFIPGVSLSPGLKQAFIQVIDGITCNTRFISYPVESFSSDKKKLGIKVGDSFFSEERIVLDINDDELSVKGELSYSSNARYPRKLFSPGIMGWYSFVPRMECRHAIVSANHLISGQLSVNGSAVDFSGGKGYAEKDWGTSFPEAWLWCQANNFSSSDASLFVSVAKIPWMGRHFTGLIAFLLTGGKFYLYATYNGSVIRDLTRSSDEVAFSLKGRDTTLRVRIIQRGSGLLKAPVSGRMSRIIRESVDSDVEAVLTGSGGNVIFSDYSRRAGVEIIEGIFGYIEKMK